MGLEMSSVPEKNFLVRGSGLVLSALEECLARYIGHSGSRLKIQD